MDGHEHPGLSDDALEREIEAALRVEASPEFLPRVRARIASEHVDEGGWGWLRSWRWAGGAAATTAAAILGVWTRLGNPDPTNRVDPTAGTSDREGRTREPERPAANPESAIPKPVVRNPRIPNPEEPWTPAGSPRARPGSAPGGR